MTDRMRGWPAQRLTRAAPVLLSSAAHVLLALGLYLLSTRLDVPPQLVMADLVEHPTGGLERQRRSALPEALRRRVSTPRPVTRDAAKTETPISPPSPPSPPTSPAPTSESSPTIGAEASRPVADAPATGSGQPAPAGGAGEDSAGAGPPALGHRVTPGYPENMRRAAVEGTTVILVAVRADGSVGEVRLRQSAGHADLDAAAVDAVKRWRFRPAQRRGLPVEFCCIEIPIVFRLH